MYRYANSSFKAAMAEGMADSAHMPDGNAIRAYSNWADGGWALIITGEIVPWAVILES